MDDNVSGGNKFQIGDVQIPCPTGDCSTANIIISPDHLPSGTAGQNYLSPQFTASGGTPGYTFTAANLPMSLTMSPNGVISGILMEKGEKTFSVTVTDANGCTATKVYTLNIECATNLAIAPNTVPNGIAGMSYSQTFTASGGCGGPFTYAVTAGVLPMGLSLNTDTGVLSGTPDSCGDFRFVITATDKCGCTVQKMYTLTIEGITVQVTGLFNTGVDNSNQALADGATDAHYSMTQPNGQQSSPTVLSPTALNVPWVPNSAASKWIGPASFPPPTGSYVYRTNFELPSCSALSGMIKGRWAADNAAVMRLNGVKVAELTGIASANFTLFNDFVITSGFQSGTNELLITVDNPGGVTGLRVEWTERSVECCPCRLALGPSKLLNGVIGESYHQELAVIGGMPGYTFEQTGTLPPGLIFTNGVFSGTPTAPGTYNVTIKVTDAKGCMVVRIITIVIDCQTLDLTPRTLPAGVAGVTYNQELTLASHVGAVTWSTVSGVLPPGVTLTPDGTLTGTPTTPGVYNVTIQAVDSVTCSTTRAYTFEVLCRPVTVFPPTVNPNARVGTIFNATFTASGAGGPYTFTKANGLLPPGLTLATTGVLSGTPTTAGRFNFTIKATNAMGCSGMLQYDLTVCADIVINPLTIPVARLGVPYSQFFNQTGAIGLTTWHTGPGSPPPGLSLNELTGVLSGTPIQTGSFSFTVSVTDENGCPGSQAYTMSVVDCNASPIAVNPAAMANGFVGTAYSQTLVATGGTPPRTFTINAGVAPNGLTLSTTGLLSGTPTASGTFNFTVRATDANGCFGERSYTVTISGSGLQFYSLPSPVRLLDTRLNATVGCIKNTGAFANNETRSQTARTTCSTIPANATAIIGNITVVPTGPGFLTLFPSDATQPTVANSNFKAGEVTNNFFTVGLGASGVDAGAFKIFTSLFTAGTTSDVIIDVTGYYAPPGTGGLYYHTLPTPVRLLQTFPGQTGCVLNGSQQLQGLNDANANPALDLAVDGRGAGLPSPCNAIPSDAVVLVGNATTVLPQAPFGFGYLTIYPSDATRPTVASSNYGNGDIINGPFAVKLGADGKFKVYTFSTTHLVIDISGYYSASATDANGVGLLFNPMPKPMRLLETRDIPNFPLTGCYQPKMQIPGGTAGIRTQPAWGACADQPPLTIPTTALALVGNVTVLNPAGAGFGTFFPGNVSTAPTVATTNYPFPVVFGYNRHYYVGLSPADGTFKILTSATSDVILDVSGYFAP